jgi:hypothetical protein
LAVSVTQLGKRAAICAIFWFTKSGEVRSSLSVMVLSELIFVFVVRAYTYASLAKKAEFYKNDFGEEVKNAKSLRNEEGFLRFLAFEWGRK